MIYRIEQVFRYRSKLNHFIFDINNELINNSLYPKVKVEFKPTDNYNNYLYRPWVDLNDLLDKETQKIVDDVREACDKLRKDEDGTE